MSNPNIKQQQKQRTDDRKVSISKVEVQGLDKKLEPVLTQLFEPLNISCKDFPTTLSTLAKIVGKLEAFEIIKTSNIKLQLDESNNNKNGTVVPIVVKLECEPSSKLSLETGTEFGNQQGSVNTNLTLRNFLNNRGEKLDISASYGSKVTSNLQVNLSKPIDVVNSSGTLALNAYQHRTDNSLYQSHALFQRGCQLLVKNLTANSNYQYGIGLVQRDVEPSKFLASPTVREAGGPDFKLSFIHNFIKDTRDCQIVPKSGNYLRVNQELAGLLGANKFYRAEFKLNTHHHLGRNFILSLGLHTGLLHQFEPITAQTHISDKFGLGGPTSVRGFLTQGLGPTDFRDRLGGNLLAAIGVSLYTPLPYFTTPRLQGHMFVNAGHLLDKKPSESYKNLIEKLVKQPSAAFGFGLIYRQGIVRLELNYTLPLMTHLNDKVNAGFQLGLGIDYL